MYSKFHLKTPKIFRYPPPPPTPTLGHFSYFCSKQFRDILVRFPLAVWNLGMHYILCHYENMPIQIYWKFYHPKKNFQIKKSDIFHNSAQNIDCGHSLEPPRRGGSNECPQSMFLSRNKKQICIPCKSSFTIRKVVFKGGAKLYRHVFLMFTCRSFINSASACKRFTIPDYMCSSCKYGLTHQRKQKWISVFKINT